MSTWSAAGTHVAAAVCAGESEASMSDAVSIELLNHASVILQHHGISLLCDPWFDGTCFRGGWGLRYLNPTALAKTIDCTHLWISHFHSDHLHLPTLQQVAQRVPQICALANVSLNFDMRGPLQRAGFTKVDCLYERYPVSLSDSCEVTQYPTTGIDNMLVVRMGRMTILNLNDCNLPAGALRSLVRKIGRIDILLVNYNHAGKLLAYPSHEQIKETFMKRFQVVIAAINPTWVIPFASLHYYRSQASAYQNWSLLTAEELSAAASTVISLAPGDRAVFVSGRGACARTLDPWASVHVSGGETTRRVNPLGTTRGGGGSVSRAYSTRLFGFCLLDPAARHPGGRSRPGPCSRSREWHLRAGIC
jgi:hypothetical protein